MRLLFLRIIFAAFALLLLCSCTETGNELQDNSAQRLDVTYSGGAAQDSDNNLDGNVVSSKISDTSMPETVDGPGTEAAGGKPGTQTEADSGNSVSGGKPGTQIAADNSDSTAGEKPGSQTEADRNNSSAGGKRDVQAKASNKGTLATGAKKNGTYVANDVHLGKLNVGGLSDKQLAARLQKIAAKQNINARNALFNQRTWEITNEQVGRRLDTAALMKIILSAGPGERIKYKYINIYPKVTKEQLDNIREISKFSTRLIDRSRSRIYNIKRAGNCLNNSIIMPGYEFSFNNATGSRTLLDGYKNATIIKKTPIGVKHIKGPAGGVCQLSTTIYNAALKAKLQITERHKHSDEVQYVKEGMDATVMYGGADLKFVNNREHPIMIKVIVGKKSVTVKFLENTSL